MVLLGVVFLIVFFYLFLFGFIIVFKDVYYDLGIFKSLWVGLKNFEFFFKILDVFIIIRNIFFYNFVFIVFGNLAVIVMAIVLSEMRVRFMVKFY